MRQNFDPLIWGPHAWFFLETITMSYPESPSEEDKKNIKIFFNSLKFVIPCEKCRNNYISHLEKYPLDDNNVKSRDNLFKWIVDIHNSVDINKQRTYQETANFYMKSYSNESNFFGNDILNMIKIVLIIILIISVYKIFLYLAKK